MHFDYRARLKGGPQVARMLQARTGRSDKQQQEQNSPNLVHQLQPISALGLEKTLFWQPNYLPSMGVA